MRNPSFPSFFTNLVSCPAAPAVLPATFVEDGGNDGFCGFRGKVGLFLFVQGFSVVLQTTWSPTGFWFFCFPSFFVLHLFIVSLRWVGTQTS